MRRHLFVIAVALLVAGCASSSHADANGAEPAASRDAEQQTSERDQQDSSRARLVSVEEPLDQRQKTFVESIRDRHTARRDAVAGCFDDHLPETARGEGGSVAMAVQAEGDGETADVFVAAAPDFESRELAACLEGIFSDLQYAAPGATHLFDRAVTISADTAEVRFGEVTRLQRVEGGRLSSPRQSLALRAFGTAWAPRVRECRSQATGDEPDVDGRVRARIRVFPDGEEVEVTIEESTVNDEGVEACFADLLRGMPFQRVAGEEAATLRHVLTLRSGE